MSHSAESLARNTRGVATPASVTRGLGHIGWTQRAAARAIGQSPALVSMVLRGKVKSQRCLDKLAALIAKTGATI